MCDFEKGFKLCTCVEPKETIHNKNSRRYKKLKKELPKRYIWRLAKYKGPSNSHLVGMYYMPSSQLGEDLSSDFVLENLNTTNCFDFDYQAAQGDCLKIYPEGSYSNYMSFIFKENKWAVDHYNPFLTETDEFERGEVKAVG